MLIVHTAGGSKRSFEIIEVISASKQLLIQDKNNHDIVVGDILTDETSNLDYTVVTIDKNPDINKFSGDLLYIDNRTTVSYSDQQLVTLRTIIRL